MGMTKKVKIIQCQHCRYYTPLGDTLEGICRVSRCKAYRKWNYSCDKALMRKPMQ
jgi:hypothetical protein